MHGRRFILILVCFLGFLVAACGNGTSANAPTSTRESSASTVAPTVVPVPSAELDPTRLPLGDGKIAALPISGSVLSCQTRFMGGGAFRDGPWIKADGTWDSTAKIAVTGEVTWPYELSVQVEGDKRLITTNDLPNHATGTFPVRSTDLAFQFDRNPNSIQPQALQLELPARPAIAAQPSCLPMGPIGVMLSGSVFFNALDAQGKDAVAHEIQDSCHGHPEMRGLYHYHGPTPCLPDPGSGHSALLGYALDGFGIYGTRGEGGAALTNADLDECHGHTHTVDWDGQQVEMYHYHLTDEYPYTLGCFRGAPVQLAR